MEGTYPYVCTMCDCRITDGDVTWTVYATRTEVLCGECNDKTERKLA